MLIILLIAEICTMTTKQTPALSEFEFRKPTLIKVPEHVYVTGWLYKRHPYYLVKKGTLHKNLQKYIDIGFDEEVEYRVEIGRDEIMHDIQNVGDFSAQVVGILGTSFLISALFRLFA